MIQFHSGFNNEFKGLKMRIDILTACPELLESPLNHSIIQRAKDKGIAEIYVHNLRDYTLDKHRKIDDYAFGFGAGMVLQCDPIFRCIEKLKSERDYDEVIFTAPDGERFCQPMANQLSMKENIIILCGHYKGVDQRVRDHFHLESRYVYRNCRRQAPTHLHGFGSAPLYEKDLRRQNKRRIFA